MAIVNYQRAEYLSEEGNVIIQKLLKVFGITVFLSIYSTGHYETILSFLPSQCPKYQGTVIGFKGANHQTEETEEDGKV